MNEYTVPFTFSPTQLVRQVIARVVKHEAPHRSVWEVNKAGSISDYGSNMCYMSFLHCFTCIISRGIRAVKGKGKRKGDTCQADTEGRRETQFYQFWTTAVELSGCTAPRPGLFNPWKKTRYPLYRRLGGPRGRCGPVHGITSHLGSNFGPAGPQRVAIPAELLNPPKPDLASAICCNSISN